MLSDVQQRAVRYVRSHAEESAPVAEDIEVTLNFHPDRVTIDGRSILSSLHQEGVYLSQFVTKQSNGGLSAFPGGGRWEWESRIFGRVYDDSTDAERPVYGALNFRRKKIGAAPRFGSAFFVLKPTVLSRCTFCYPDSYYNPDDFGCAEHCQHLINLALSDDKDALDDYIEAQVHGAVVLSRDVHALVLDPCYRNTPIEDEARKLPCEIQWHHGLRLALDVLQLHGDYRGEEVVEVGRTVAVDGFIDAGIIGHAVRAGVIDAQLLKKLWHCVVKFGVAIE